MTTRWLAAYWLAGCLIAGLVEGNTLRRCPDEWRNRDAFYVVAASVAAWPANILAVLYAIDFAPYGPPSCPEPRR